MASLQTELREIAGLHYPSDTEAGVKLAGAISTKILLDRASPAYLPRFRALVECAKAEWAKSGVFIDEDGSVITPTGAA